MPDNVFQMALIASLFLEQMSLLLSERNLSSHGRASYLAIGINSRIILRTASTSMLHAACAYSHPSQCGVHPRTDPGVQPRSPKSCQDQEPSYCRSPSDAGQCCAPNCHSTVGNTPRLNHSPGSSHRTDLKRSRVPSAVIKSVQSHLVMKSSREPDATEANFEIDERDANTT